MPRKKNAKTTNPSTSTPTAPPKEAWLRKYWDTPREAVLRRGEAVSVHHLQSMEGCTDTNTTRARELLEAQGIRVFPGFFSQRQHAKCGGYVLTDHCLERIHRWTESESASSPAGESNGDDA